MASDSRRDVSGHVVGAKVDQVATNCLARANDTLVEPPSSSERSKDAHPPYGTGRDHSPSGSGASGLDVKLFAANAMGQFVYASD